MKTDKYYTTNIYISGEKLEKIKELGASNNFQRQFNIICKAKSLAEANRIAEALGLSNKTFQRNNTSEIGNIELMELADKMIFIICLDGVFGNRYIKIENFKEGI